MIFSRTLSEDLPISVSDPSLGVGKLLAELVEVVVAEVVDRY